MHERVSRLIGRAEAEGLVDVAYAETDTPVGRLLVAATPRGLVRVSFHGEAHDEVRGELRERGRRYGPPVHPRDAPTRRDVAGDDQRAVVGLDAHLPEQPRQALVVGIELEDPLDTRRRRAGPDDLRAQPRAEQS